MPKISYSLVTIDEDEFLTVLDPNGEALVATTASHSNFEELIAAARAGDEKVYDLFEAGKAIQRKFKDIANGRVTVVGGVVLFDGDPLGDSVAVKILEFHDKGEDFSPLARFVENIMANPNEHSRAQFYNFIEKHHFPITDDGCIVAYKGVKGTEGAYTSISSGKAWVNNVEFDGYIPNAVGDTVTMPRSEVNSNPKVACHKGLHAGSWKYAKDFSQSVVMLVKINPRDVVSVPDDYSHAKVRVCRYEVIGFATSENEALRHIEDKPVAKVQDTTKATAVKPFANRSKVWHDGDKVVIKDDAGTIGVREYRGRRGVVRHKDDRAIARGAAFVYVGGNRIAVWDGDLKADKQAGAVDTRRNHLSQKRGPGGRFVKNGS